MSEPKIDGIHPSSDNLPEDIQGLIAATRVNGLVGVHDERKLMEMLIIYIVKRDHRIFDYAKNLNGGGKKNGAKQRA